MSTFIRCRACVFFSFSVKHQLPQIEIVFLYQILSSFLTRFLYFVQHRLLKCIQKLGQGLNSAMKLYGMKVLDWENSGMDR